MTFIVEYPQNLISMKTTQPKKRGRPVGSKNKFKTNPFTKKYKADLLKSSIECVAKKVGKELCSCYDCLPVKKHKEELETPAEQAKRWKSDDFAMPEKYKEELIRHEDRLGEWYETRQDTSPLNKKVMGSSRLEGFGYVDDIIESANQVKSWKRERADSYSYWVGVAAGWFGAMIGVGVSHLLANL